MLEDFLWDEQKNVSLIDWSVLLGCVHVITGEQSSHGSSRICGTKGLVFRETKHVILPRVPEIHEGLLPSVYFWGSMFSSLFFTRRESHSQVPCV